jgi:hypothetical protein
MATCDYCGAGILFGGKSAGMLRFCGENCLRNGRHMINATAIPQDVLERRVRQVHQGPCPRCGGDGPVDIHTCHDVMSFVFLIRWRSMPRICCRKCGLLGQLWGVLYSLILGWWGWWWVIPIGFILTPIQIARNLKGIVFPPDPRKPSPMLVHMVAIELGKRRTPGAFLRRSDGYVAPIEEMDGRFG